jgi:hypothetical protein
MLVQRAVGLGLRKCLKDKLGIDLDHLADVHRRSIKDVLNATIDLSDCSDAIGLSLVEYLLPKRVFRKILNCRSDMTYGPDGNYYVTHKVSSMGNGFTFDLMTVILLSLTRTFDNTSSVFGDDIICRTAVAEGVIKSLTLAGFTVNPDKTNINTGYRESCGSHYLDGVGYLSIFDLRWIKTPHDLIVSLNKIAILSSVYGGPFDSLKRSVWSCIPCSLLGAAVARPTVNVNEPPSYCLDVYVRYGGLYDHRPSRNLLRKIRRVINPIQLTGRISYAIGFVERTNPGPINLKSNDWDMFYQNIHSGRRLKRVGCSVHKSIVVARVDGQQIGTVFCPAVL